MAGMALGPYGWWPPGSYKGGYGGPSKPFRAATHRAGRYRTSGRVYARRGGRFKKKSRRSCLLGMNPEKKFVDIGLSTLPAVTGTVDLLSLVPQGPEESQRVGRKISITNINIKGHILLSGTTAAVTANRVRIAVVWDKQSNGTAMTAAQVWNIAGTADINAYRALDNIGRFVILYDKVHSVSVPLAGLNASLQSGTALRTVNISIKCCIPIEYDNSANTGAMSTQLVNSVHLVTFEEVTSPATTFSHISRIRYVD